ncbi:SOS response-associated peptidase [Chthonobacter albigriseus]|uniref:SOS response-associated peptidase n=1 Tax=Chthonobacter albigriseus TaxID=1683161 RepID=UPI0015EE8679|nr:SOS response-associated peptidase [Chthonobacter albigriseus]
MCGRYTLTMTPEELKRLFRYVETPNFPPRYNIAPTQPIAIVRGEHGECHFQLVRWGLIPSWVKDPDSFTLLLNARSETAAEKPAFRGAMRHRRCLVPASGFYEWRRVGTTKQPFFIRPRDGGVVAFAGLWESWLGADGSEIDTAAILTTGANRLVAQIHDRMPLVIDEADWDRWLDTAGAEPRHVAELLRPAPETLFEAIPVSTRVNAVRNDDKDVQEPISEPLVGEDGVTGDEEAEPAQGRLF